MDELHLTMATPYTASKIHIDPLIGCVGVECVVGGAPLACYEGCGLTRCDGSMINRAFFVRQVGGAAIGGSLTCAQWGWSQATPTQILHVKYS